MSGVNPRKNKHGNVLGRKMLDTCGVDNMDYRIGFDVTKG